LDDTHVRAGLEQRFLRAAQVAGAVIKQGNHADNLATDPLRRAIKKFEQKVHLPRLLLEVCPRGAPRGE
jgi:hypothetical protein